MNWLSSLFSSNSQRIRKGQALSSTHEAFSLPTSSPIFASQVDLHADLDPETATSASFSYPPQSNSYGYLPTSAASSSRTNSLLPVHHDTLHTPISPTMPYPPLSKSWNRIKNWLAREYPELGDTLNYGILPEDLAQIEMQFGFALPAVVRESYLAVDGQEPESAAGCSEGLFYGLSLLPLEDVLDEWRFWREVDEDPSTGGNPHLKEVMESIPPDWIRRDYSQRGWIPLIADKAGNYIGVDLNPAEKGAIGQVIVFGRDFDTKVVLFSGDGTTGWAKWLASFADDLESGEGFEIGLNEYSDGSEDDIGYEGYFYDGSGRGQGDGGGDNGSGGGLRLNGEYRGWNVLEALADRSVRRWIEAGVITEEVRQEDEKVKGETLVGIVEAPAAEVAIPVLAEENLAPPTNATRKLSPSNLPIISVTKPPAPLPVELPTPADLMVPPSPPNSARSFDLESGRSPQAMKQHEIGLISRKSTENSQPGSNPVTPTSRSFATTNNALPTPPQTQVVDLLVDTSPALETTPIIQPSALPSEQKSPPHDPDESADGIDPDVTIRLIGGGGVSGLAEGATDDTVFPDGEEEVKDDASVTSSASESSVNGEKKHKKTKSGLAGLKKLGSLGGLRKKDSVSVEKEEALASST